MVLIQLWNVKLSAQGNTTVTKQSLYDNLELKNESNQERLGALKLQKKKKKSDRPPQSTLVTGNTVLATL